jgi:adenine C2-methylase RlmN of 23S rRNA A2503 and tRNA A37
VSGLRTSQKTIKDQIEEKSMTMTVNDYFNRASLLSQCDKKVKQLEEKANKMDVSNTHQRKVKAETLEDIRKMKAKLKKHHAELERRRQASNMTSADCLF